jgi:cytochrome c553
MMRPLTFAASLVLASLPLLASAQDTAPGSTASDATTTSATPVPATATPTTSTPAATAGDAARGRQLVYTCQGCHGVEGYKNAYPNYHVPKIGGQTESYLIVALTAYGKGERKHPTMQAQAESFSDQDIADIAAYLSSVK